MMIGESIAHYRVTAKLAAGGMAKRIVCEIRS
jgi:hypothetical protein